MNLNGSSRKSFATHSRVATFLLLAGMLSVTLCAPAFASDHSFNALVHHIERQYGVRHTHIPMLGMVMFFAKPHGMHTLKIATFEDFHPKREVFGPEVQQMIEQHFGPEWKPFVRTWSRSGEASFIYANSASSEVAMLIVALDTDDATVVEIKVDPSAMDEWMNEPDKMVQETTWHHPQDTAAGTAPSKSDLPDSQNPKNKINDDAHAETK